MSIVCLCSFKQPGRLLHVSDVGLDGDSVGPQALDHGHDFLGRPARAGIVHDYLCSGTGQLDGDGRANAAACTGHEGHLAIQTEWRGHLICLDEGLVSGEKESCSGSNTGDWGDYF